MGLIYAARDDFELLGLPAKALRGVENEQLDLWLSAAAAKMNTYIRKGYSLPITGVLTPSNTHPAELIRCNCIIAAWDGLRVRGHHPDQFDQAFEREYERCIEWLRELAAGTVTLDGAVDATPAVREGAPAVFSAGTPRTNAETESNTQRGW